MKLATLQRVHSGIYFGKTDRAYFQNSVPVSSATGRCFRLPRADTTRLNYLFITLHQAGARIQRLRASERAQGHASAYIILGWMVVTLDQGINFDNR